MEIIIAVVSACTSQHAIKDFKSKLNPSRVGFTDISSLSLLIFEGGYDSELLNIYFSY